MATQQKIALVTGGGRGIGKDIALNLAAAGTDVILTYNNDIDAANKVKDEIISKGRKAAVLQLNTALTNTFGNFFSQLTDTLKNEFGTSAFDYLVNNAGVGLRAMTTETTEEQFDTIMNIHVKGVYFLTQGALSLMNDGGGIVNISSGLTRITFPGSGAYASAKAAVEVFTRYMARELGSRQIRANVVAPGAIATDFNGGMIRDNEHLNKMVAELTALGRVGQAEDIGGVVAFLCSPQGGWINGQRIEVSGGQAL